MRVVPSIDVEGGVAVKRVRGEKGTGLRLGPATVVLEDLASRGFSKVHVVDLRGAVRGSPTRQVLQLLSLAARLGVEVRVGGGFRSREHVNAACERGAVEVVVGSLWILDPLEAARLVESSPCRLVAAVDVRGGRVAYSGWKRVSGLSLEEALKRVERLGFEAILVTDVDSEGTLSGVNIGLAIAARRAFSGRLYYAGGIASLRDLEVLESLGYEEAIVGMALYTGRIPVEVALAYA